MEKAKALGWIGLRVEPRFVAHRHWSLDSAMYYSDYIATRLRDNDPDSPFGALWACVTPCGDRGAFYSR